MSDAPVCSCNGIRFCALCKDSERVKKIFSGDIALNDTMSVISNQQKEGRTSSCSFALIGKAKYSMCIECGTVFSANWPLRNCSEHCDGQPESLVLRGVKVARDFISEEEEKGIVNFLDEPSPFPAWKCSQSGRRKQDYGPKRNFKKKKIKLADIPAMPSAFRTLFERVADYTKEITGTLYEVAEASVLEYKAESLSNFDPHVDDTWLWGDRVVGVNMLEDCCMTFVNSNGDAVEVFLPHRCYFVMSGESRYDWMHAIRPESVQCRRISITIRELSTSLSNDPSGRAVAECAKTYI